MRRVLLTGASGFIGSACIAPLQQAGFEVHAVSRTARAWPAEVQGWRADLLDDEEVRRLLATLRPSHLLHVAWDVTHGAFWTAPNNLRWLAAGVGLLDAFRETGGARALGVGTCAEYAWTVPHLGETDGPSAAATPYGRCKRALGDAFAAADGLGMSTAWGRLFFPYGPGDPPQRLLPGLMTSLAAGRRFATSAGTQVRDFVHIHDIGAALVATLASSVRGAVNIASGRGTPVRHIIEVVAEEMGRPELVDFDALPIRPGDPPELVADLRRLTEEVGFRPSFTLEAGLADTVAAFRRAAL